MTMTTQRQPNPLFNSNDPTAVRDAKDVGYRFGVAWQPFVSIFQRIEKLEALQVLFDSASEVLVDGKVIKKRE